MLCNIGTKGVISLVLTSAVPGGAGFYAIVDPSIKLSGDTTGGDVNLGASDSAGVGGEVTGNFFARDAYNSIKSTINKATEEFKRIITRL